MSSMFLEKNYYGKFDLIIEWDGKKKQKEKKEINKNVWYLFVEEMLLDSLIYSFRVMKYAKS